MKDFLLELGIKLPDIVAGAAGGIVNAIAFKRSGPLALIGSVLVGALTANYLMEYGVRFLGLSQGASGFILGLVGMVVCQTIVAQAKKWRPTQPSGGTDGRA